MKQKDIPVVVVVGQTATGKSDLAVEIAKELNGEVISADSRQVYKEFNLTSGKVTEEEMQGVPHYLLDVLSVKDGVFTAYDFAKLAREEIKNIHNRGKLPIVAGGTGFYVDVLLGRINLEDLPKDENLRSELEGKSKEELFEELLKLNSERAGEIDRENKVRLVRAVEIEILKQKRGKEVLRGDIENGNLSQHFNPVWIGIAWDKETLRARIKKRLQIRHESNMCDEVLQAHKAGVSWERLEELGLEMKYCAKLLKSEMTEEEFLETLFHKIWQYAKRQKTYWKRNENIKWFHPDEGEKIIKYIESVLVKG